MKQIIKLWILLLAFSCKESPTSRNHKNLREGNGSAEQIEVLGNFNRNQASGGEENKSPLNDGLPIDTVSLRRFWKDFQSNISQDRRDEVLKVLTYPVHAVYFVYFKYSYDCDTIQFNTGFEKYSDVDFDKEKLFRNYDFAFPTELKSMIMSTSWEQLFANRNQNGGGSGLTYTFYPKNYKSIRCPNDHGMHFSFYKTENVWKVSIIGF